MQCNLEDDKCVTPHIVLSGVGDETQSLVHGRHLTTWAWS